MRMHKSFTDSDRLVSILIIVALVSIIGALAIPTFYKESPSQDDVAPVASE